MCAIQKLKIHLIAHYSNAYKICQMLQRWDKLLSTGTVLYSTKSRQYRKWSRDRKWSPKWTANDPRPQVIPKVDRKWCREKLRNGMDCMGLITKRTDYKIKRNLFLSPSKEKGKEDATSRVNLYKAKKKKWNKFEKDMILTIYFILCQNSIYFQECFVA